MTKAILCFVFFVLLFGILSGVQWSVSNSFPSPSSSWIEVKVNDQIVITASLDANPRYFQVQVFDLVQVIYHMGIPMLAFMDDYTIYDHNGQVIVTEGQGNAIPQSMAQPMLITDPTVGTIYNITNDYYFLQPGEPNNYNGIEDYAAWISGIGASWIDIDENHPFQAIMEIEPYDQSFVLSLGPSSGTLSPAASESITLSADGSALPDGVYHLSIRLQASDIQNAQFYPVTLNVNRAVVSAPSGLTFDTTLSHAEAIHISWAANNSTENITQYKVYRMNSGWTLIGTVPGSQTWFLDSNLGGLEGIIQYKVSAVNSLGMEGPASEVLNTWKLTFAPPENVVVNINPGGEIQISWTPVTQALCGSPASPNYYFIYAGSDPTAPESFARVAVVGGAQWQGSIDYDRRFYYVVSYSGAAIFPEP